jgi:hypothetical protein
MQTRTKIAATLSGTALAVTAFASAAPAPAFASAQAPAHVCTYHHVSGTNHWACITPGAFCPRAAHEHWGWAKVTGRHYWCEESTPIGRWRWLRND